MDYGLALLIWIVCGIGSVLIAQNKGATNLATWFLVGILLGPIGIILAALGAKGSGRQAAPAIGAADELQKLAALRDNGTITDAEFQGQKAGLLTVGPRAADPPKTTAQRAVFVGIVVVLVAAAIWMLSQM